MHIVSTRVAVAVAAALAAVNLGLVSGQLTGNFRIPTLSGFDEPFDNSQISAGGEGGSGIPEASGETLPTIGPMGPAGAAGPTGARGPKGPAGIQGKTGPQGPQGIQGLTGEQGPIGLAGSTGSTGSTGLSGVAGTNGIPGLPGAVGVTGPQGLVGSTGAPGEQGAQGVQGVAGEIGVKGDTGDTGPMGPSGVIAATAPLEYNSTTKTITLNQSQITQVGSLDYLQFSLLASATDAPGRLRWNEAAGTLNLQLRDGVSNLQLGQESVQQITNNSGAIIPNGTAVRVSGGAGSKLAVVLADNSTVTGATAVLGVSTQSIAIGADGYVTTYGLVHDVNTSAWSPGAPLYLSTLGQMTTTRPANGRIVQLGFVVSPNATTGSIYVNPIQSFDPIIGGLCVVPGQTGNGVYAWHNLTGARWIVVCDY